MTQPDQAAATADLGSVFGTPTFFINGQRHYGSYDVDSLKQAVRTARALAAIATCPGSPDRDATGTFGHGLAGWKTGARRLLSVTRPTRRRL